MKTKNRYPLWLQLVIVLVIAGLIVVLIGFALRLAYDTSTTSANRNAQTYTVANQTATTPEPIYQPEVANAPKAVVENQYITVFRGATDQETINFNDAWPGYSAKDNINWFDTNGYSKIHMLGGTYILPCDGVISGDVKVNGVPIYDNNEKTFLVINVKKGYQIDADPNWMAWFTNAYSEDLIVQAVQTQFPTWTRQESKLN